MIVIVDYAVGNVSSVRNALGRLGYDSIVTQNTEIIRNADKVILPGVGDAAVAMREIKERSLDTVIPALVQPVLGICLGMQILCRSTQEGNVDCLNVFPVDVKKFPPGYCVPHMGWNTLTDCTGTLFQEIDTEPDVYFVHSYHAPVCEYSVATCDYILPFSAAIAKNNFYATQFHPEKSAGTGELIFKNFLTL